MHRHKAPAGLRRQAIGGALALAVLLPLGLASLAAAEGNKFTWTRDGNTAAAFWRSFVDDAAYVTVSTEARQRKGRGKMYVQVRFYSLRCSGGQNTCASVGAGGVVQVTEGAEWHMIGQKRHRPNLSRRRSNLSASHPLDTNATAMQVRVQLCQDRSRLPDPCSKPRIGTHVYQK